jgi:2-keto-3-deoxy-L-rhamnonate aldolase RhmA
MIALMRPNPVRDTLRAGGTAYGTMAFEFFSPGLIAILAEAGADFVLLDTEHRELISKRSRCRLGASA